jgi:hypothetical protein
MFPDKKFPQTFRIQSLWHETETEKIYYRIRRCVCERQHESGTKTFRFRDESENFRSSVNCMGLSFSLLVHERIKYRVLPK